MAYSYVEIPEMPVWDSVSYPYLLIGMVYEQDADDWYTAHCYYSSVPYTYSPGGVMADEAIGRLVCNGLMEGWQVYNGSWEYQLDTEFWNADSVGHNFGFVDNVVYRYWTNHEIKKTDGSTYLAANSVTPMNWRGLKDWIRGLVIGTASKPVPFGGVKDGFD